MKYSPNPSMNRSLPSRLGFNFNHNMNITITFDSFVALTLDYENQECRVLPDHETGIIVHTLIKDNTLFKVQFEDFDGSPLERPKLWHYPAWANSRVRYLQAKDRSEKERVAQWILDANVKIVMRVLIREWGFMPDKAISTAYELLKKKKFGSLRAFGVGKLVTKEEELK